MASFQRIFSGSGWKHAVAEIALIVVGITIALWADAWVGDRRDAQRENARLTALHADTDKTLAAISEIHEDTSDAAIALRKILEMQPPRGPDERVLDLLRHGLLFGSAFYPEMSVYDDLKSSGELALLTNPGLRRSLSSMKAGLEQLRLAQADLTVVQQLNIDSYMVDHMDLTDFYGDMTGLKLPDGGSIASYEFIDDREFRNRVLLKLDLVVQLETVIEETQSRVLAVKRSIESELGN